MIAVPEKLEIWKEIKGFSGYQVSTFGNIKSLSREINTFRASRTKREQILKFKYHPSGYHYINLRKNSKPKTLKVHRLVAQSFIDNPENKPEVNHKDGNKLNNHVDNLEWNTAKENSRHKIATGLYISRKGSDCPASKLTETNVLAIRRLHSINPRVSHAGIAKKFNMNRSTIGNIINRRLWKHLAA